MPFCVNREEFGFNDTTTKASLLSNIQALEHRSYSSGNSQAGRAIEYVGSLFDDLVRPVETPQPTKVSVWRLVAVRWSLYGQ